MSQYQKITRCAHCRKPVHRDDKELCGYCDCTVHRACSNCAAAGNLPGVRGNRKPEYVIPFTPRYRPLPYPVAPYDPSAFPPINKPNKPIDVRKFICESAGQVPRREWYN